MARIYPFHWFSILIKLWFHSNIGHLYESHNMTQTKKSFGTIPLSIAWSFSRDRLFSWARAMITWRSEMCAGIIELFIGRYFTSFELFFIWLTFAVRPFICVIRPEQGDQTPDGKGQVTYKIRRWAKVNSNWRARNMLPWYNILKRIKISSRDLQSDRSEQVRFYPSLVVFHK